MSAARNLVVQLCAAGRPALYKLAANNKDPSLGLTRLPIGQSGVRLIGEDAVFVLNPPCGGSFGFGVADGVGGWRDQGVDPGQAALALMTACSSSQVFVPPAATEGKPPAPQPPTSLKAALAAAHRGLLETRRDLVGSTTACLARLTLATRALEVANLGDSGLCVVDSEFRLKMRTRFQSNMGGVFNCPMQLAFPSALSKQYPKPEDCELYSVTMEPGDIALMATDGLWDNLHQPTIEEIFRQAFQKTGLNQSDKKEILSDEMPLETAARMLVDAATYLSAQQDYESPFCDNARLAGKEFVGGKEDDVSLVLARLAWDSPGGETPASPKARL